MILSLLTPIFLLAQKNETKKTEAKKQIETTLRGLFECHEIVFEQIKEYTEDRNTVEVKFKNGASVKKTGEKIEWRHPEFNYYSSAFWSPCDSTEESGLKPYPELEEVMTLFTSRDSMLVLFGYDIESPAYLLQRINVSMYIIEICGYTVSGLIGFSVGTLRYATDEEITAYKKVRTEPSVDYFTITSSIKGKRGNGKIVFGARSLPVSSKTEK